MHLSLSTLCSLSSLLRSRRVGIECRFAKVVKDFTRLRIAETSTDTNSNHFDLMFILEILNLLFSFSMQ